MKYMELMIKKVMAYMGGKRNVCRVLVGQTRRKETIWKTEV
jgi:hypothetical protein